MVNYKHYILIILFIYGSNYKLSSQISKIEGIGNFKISKTTTLIISELEKELNTNTIKVHSVLEIFDLEKKSNAIAEILPDTIDEYSSPIKASFCPDVKVFYINKYKISEITCKDVYLTFYKGLLTEFQCDVSDELSEAMVIKYGKPTKEKKEKYIDCFYNYSGNVVKHKEITVYEKWNNVNIKAQIYSSEYFNNSCEKSFISILTIYKDGVDKLISACDKKMQQTLKTRRLKEKKDKLSGF